MSAVDPVVLVSFVCVSCERPVTMELGLEGFLRWRAGETIQSVMPDVSSQEREMLIMSLCEPCVVVLYNSLQASDGE